jgi:hypothetical protein
LTENGYRSQTRSDGGGHGDATVLVDESVRGSQTG